MFIILREKNNYNFQTSFTDVDENGFPSFVKAEKELINSGYEVIDNENHEYGLNGHFAFIKYIELP